MKKTHTTKYALLIAAALIAYFIIIDLIGLANESYLSFFNAVIVGVGIFFVIRATYMDQSEFKYFDGFIAGLKAGVIATVIYTLFMAVYLFELRPGLASELEEQISIAGEGIEVALLLFIALSGFATSAVIPLVVLPLYKKSWNTRNVRANQKPLNQ